MINLKCEQTITYTHSFEIEGATDDDIDEFLFNTYFDSLDDVHSKLCHEFGYENVTFIEDGSGEEEFDFM